MRASDFLVEKQYINLAKKAYDQLSDQAKVAIDQWEAANWTEGLLAKHISANDKIAQEIEKAFAPVKATLPDQIKLYRGIIKQEDYDSWKKATLESWTDDKRVAEHFAGLRQAHSWKSNLHNVETEEQIKKLVDQYEKTGFLKYQNKYYVRNKEQPQYYNIYDRNKQFVTDGDDLLADLTGDANWKQELNQTKQDKAFVYEEMISKDRIVWITNSVNCKEFIVKK